MHVKDLILLKPSKEQSFKIGTCMKECICCVRDAKVIFTQSCNEDGEY